MHSLHTAIPGTLDIGGQIIEKNYVLWMNIEFFCNHEIGAWIRVSASDIIGYKNLIKISEFIRIGIFPICLVQWVGVTQRVQRYLGGEVF